MNSRFSLFQTPVDLAHALWERLVVPGDIVIDATCGNGHDTLKLAQLVGPDGHVHAFDVQEEAIAATKARVAEYEATVTLHQASHAVFPEKIRQAKLIVYNLGYLPGGDKELTTYVESTLLSLQHALALTMRGGAISVTLYPGHAEGFREAEAVFTFVGKLSPREWSVCHHQWLNRRRSPSLLLLQKAI